MLPPAFQFLLVFLGLALWRVYRPLAWLCFITSFSSLFLLSVPAVSSELYKTLEIYPAVTPQEWGEANHGEDTVIVVLGGGRDENAYEYGGETIHQDALLRVRYGAKVADLTGLPILVSGGSVYGRGKPEAELLADVFKEFGYDKVLMERSSKNTWENAKYTADLIDRLGFKRVILVTQAWHMRRSVYCFEEFGVEVIPAPTKFLSSVPIGREYVPVATALRGSSAAIKEWLGMLVYSLFYEARPSLQAEHATDEANNPA